MPLIDVCVVVAPDAPLPAGAAQRLADAIGGALGAARGSVWVRLQALQASAYAENGVARSELPWPVFVTLLQAKPPEGDALQRQIDALCGAVAACLGREAARVHVEIAPAGSGRIAFGGRLVR